MAWIHSYTSLEKHHKLIRFRTAMRWSQNETVGFLHRFWWLVLEVSPSGDVTELASPEVMAETLNMKSDVVKDAISNMVKIGFIDNREGKLIIHDWLDYAGRYMSDSLFKNHKEKLAEIKRLHNVYSPSADRPPTVRRQSAIDKKEEKEEKDICVEPTKSVGIHADVSPPIDVFLEFPVVGTEKKTWCLEKKKLSEWKVSFPGVNVESECRKAWQWTHDNPTKRKTPKGMLKFLNGWISRSQNAPNSNGYTKQGGTNGGFTVER